MQRVDFATARAAVLTAFFAARRAGRPAVEAYKAGVDVWKCLYPDQSAEYAAKAAVRIMLDAIKDDMMTTDIADRAPDEASDRVTIGGASTLQ